MDDLRGGLLAKIGKRDGGNRGYLCLDFQTQAHTQAIYERMLQAEVEEEEEDLLAEDRVTPKLWILWRMLIFF